MINDVSNWIFNWWISKMTTSTRITNLINHEYIKRSFLFNRKFIQMFFYIFIIGKFGLLNMSLSQLIVGNRLILSQDMRKIFFFYLFILCTPSCNNDQMVFCMYSIANIRKPLFKFCSRLILWNNKMSNVDFNNIHNFIFITITWCINLCVYFIFIFLFWLSNLTNM